MTITFYNFDFSFLKVLLESTLYGFYRLRCLLFSTILKQNDHLFQVSKQQLVNRPDWTNFVFCLSRVLSYYRNDQSFLFF